MNVWGVKSVYFWRDENTKFARLQEFIIWRSGGGNIVLIQNKHNHSKINSRIFISRNPFSINKYGAITNGKPIKRVVSICTIPKTRNIIGAERRKSRPSLPNATVNFIYAFAGGFKTGLIKHISKLKGITISFVIINRRENFNFDGGQSLA